jgi:drug/metabolite transporter (DMT)-like permease
MVRRAAVELQTPAATGLRERESLWRAWLALALAITGTAWSAILVRWAGIPGAASGFYRVLIALLVLLPMRMFSRGAGPTSPGPGALALAGGAFFALDLALYNTAVLRTHAATAALLGNLTPIFVGFGTWLFFRRRPDRAFWMGLLLALAGCAAIVSGDAAQHAGPQRVSVVGDALATIAALFFAAFLMTTERVRTGMDTLTFNVLAVAGSALTLLVICLVRGEPLTGYSMKTWMALLALGLCSQLGAYLALVYALGHLPATITSVGLLAQVPFTAVLALVLLGEPLSTVKIVGGLVVLAGIYVVNRRPTGTSA